MTERVTHVHHWNDTLFSFRTTRDQSFRFKNGHFVMIGLPAEEGRPLLRAYSIASANHEHELEFFSIKVPDGPLTAKLQKLKVGDDVMIGKNLQERWYQTTCYRAGFSTSSALAPVLRLL